jgi:glycerol-3-phosphate cytidylyltransferase
MKIGFVASAFDLLHAGHVLMLEEAKNQCEWLVCGLHTDPSLERASKNKPIQTVFERYIQLKACRFVDEIIPYETEADLYTILTSYKIDVRIVGEEYKDKHFTGRGLEIPIYYNSRRHSMSSSELRSRIGNQNKTSIHENCYT